MAEHLTEKQAKFLELIFLPEYIDDFKKASIDAGYSTGTHVSEILKGIAKEYNERLEYYIASKAIKSLHKIDNVLSNPEGKGAKVILEAAGMILDRHGLTKKERIEVEHKAASGIFLLPAKKE